MKSGIISPEDSSSIDEVLARVRSYDPEKEFVVVFKACGLMGADVVKPKGGCENAWVRWKELKGVNESDADGVIDVDVGGS